jgi:hypothetical protein
VMRALIWSKRLMGRLCVRRLYRDPSKNPPWRRWRLSKLREVSA